MTSFPKFASSIENLMKLCKMKEGERVVLVTGPSYDHDTIDKYLFCLDYLGADFVHVVSPTDSKKRGVRTRSVNNSLIWDILKGSKLVIHQANISFYDFREPRIPHMYSGTGQGSMYELLRSGTRWLEVGLINPERDMPDLWPTEDVIKRGYGGAEVLQKAKTIRIRSETGTDITCDKTGCKAHCQVGVSDISGRWDNYGVYLVACAPKEYSANGILVMGPDDFWSGLFAKGALMEPVKLTFKDGYISKIEGGIQSKIVERWLNGTSEKDAQAFSGHVGWSTGERSQGNVTIHFGRNDFHSPAPYCGLMGKNSSSSHGGPTLGSATIYLDDELVLKNGRIVHSRCI